MATKFKTQFSHDEPDKFIFSCDTPSMTEQQFEHETNINNVLAGCVQSSLNPQTAEAMFDLTITGDEFEKALNTKADVMNYFEQLPVKAKEYFDYKPAKMLDFIQDENNYEKAYEIGLLDKDAYYARKDAFMAKQAETQAETNNIAPEVTPEASGSNS